MFYKLNDCRYIYCKIILDVYIIAFAKFIIFIVTLSCFIGTKVKEMLLIGSKVDFEWKSQEI